MKSPNFWILNGEICQTLQNFSKIWGIKTNFGQTRCPIMWKFILSESEGHFYNLLCFLFHEKILSGSYLSYVIFKVYNIWISPKNS